MKKIKGHFWYPVPFHPSMYPIHPQTRRSAPRCVNLGWTPKGVGKDLVETSVAFIRAAAPPPIKAKKEAPFNIIKEIPLKMIGRKIIQTWN